MEDKYKTNRLTLYRKRMGLSQRTVAKLLGLTNVSVLSHYELGVALPSLKRALALEILYRVPVAFLFPNLYDPMREMIREAEKIGRANV